MSVPSPLVLLYLSSDVDDETDLLKVISRIAVFEFSVLELLYFLMCTRAGPGSGWDINWSIRGRGAHGVLFYLLAPVVCLVDDEAFGKLLDHSSLDPTHVLLGFRCRQEVDWSESSSVRWFPYLLAEGVNE